MKIILTILLSVSMLFLSGCATSSYSIGKDFSSEKVQEIVKGETTSEELTKMFGEPYSKTVISSTDEKWIYMYTKSESKAQSFIVTMNVKTTSAQKTLDVLITNGVVTNFVYTEGENPHAIQVN
jgi:hypothetical protein